MRLFVGLLPPAEVLRDLPVQPGRQHVTPAFLGEVADPAALRGALSRVQALPDRVLRLAFVKSCSPDGARSHEDVVTP